MRMRLLFTLAINATSGACLMGQTLPEFYIYQLEAMTRSGRVIIDSRGVTPAGNSTRPNAVISPDRRRAAYVETKWDGSKSTCQIGIATVQNDGPFINERSLPMSADYLGDPRWMPDGRRLVYVRGNHSDSSQEVFMIDVDEPDKAPQRISEPGPRSFAPRIARDGRIAYLVERGRQGKGRLVDLIIFSDSSRKAAIEGAFITAHAFSPDGKRIAYSTYHELVIHNLENGERTVRDFNTFHDRLNSYHASCLAWRPDGQALAAVLHFSGGVVVGPDGQAPRMLGDREVFILPLDGQSAAIVFTLDDGALSVQFIDGC